MFDLESHVKSAVLDQEHLADVLRNNDDFDQKIRARIVELAEQGLIEIYTYRGEDILTLTRLEAIAVLQCQDNWCWETKARTKCLYFLAPVINHLGHAKYGTN